MDTPILSTYDISIDIENSILEAFNSLKNKYSVQFDTDFIFDINEFSTFHNNELNYFGPVIKCNVGESTFFINYIELILPHMGKSSNIALTYQIWGAVKLKKKYPRILIRTETFLDKIHELINPIELDIVDDKKFSKKFFVLTEDKQKTDLCLTSSFRSAILEIEESEIVIEIKDSLLIIGNQKSLTTEFVLEASRFLNKLSKY